MNAKHPLLLLLLVLPWAGCMPRNQPAAPPPPPAPAVAPAPAPDPQLSIPQTTAQLPSPQPVNPDAIPPVPASEPPPPEKAAPRTTRHAPAATAAPKPETEAPAASAATPENAADPAPFHPILTAEEQTRLRTAIEARRREIDDRLARAKGHSSEHDKALAERIRSFLSLAEQAAQRGDYTQADALSERALILARELKIE